MRSEPRREGEHDGALSSSFHAGNLEIFIGDNGCQRVWTCGKCRKRGTLRLAKYLPALTAQHAELLQACLFRQYTKRVLSMLLMN